ncbi:MAG: glycosyltransferase family 4 protein [Bacillota bacterium]
MKKALIVSTVVGFITSFELNDIKILQELGYSVEVASNINVDDGEAKVSRLQEMNVVVHNINFSRSPFSMSTFKAYKELKKRIKAGEYDLIHCHTPVAGILTRLAAKKSRKKGTRVIYTAHGFHFFKGAPKLNWMIYYLAEKLCAKYTDTLITINTEDFELAKKKFKAKEVKYITGVGIDAEKFKNVVVDKQAKRAELGLTDENIVLLSVGELNENKNHQVIIKALGKIQNSNIHYLIAGIGDKEEELEQLAKENNVNLHLLGYRRDIVELFQISNIYTHPSHREGLSVALMEAMASGLPCVVSDIRGNRDLFVLEKGGFLSKSTDIESFANAIVDLAVNKNLREEYAEFNMTYINNFHLDKVEKTMREIYE